MGDRSRRSTMAGRKYVRKDHRATRGLGKGGVGKITSCTPKREGNMTEKGVFGKEKRGRRQHLSLLTKNGPVKKTEKSEAL